MNDANTSIVFPADTAPHKEKTDVILTGSAYAPDNVPIQTLDIALQVGAKRKVLRVTGDRVWKVPPWILGWNVSSPTPFTRMELTYERAYGGVDGTAPGYCTENPVGCGFIAKRSKKEIADSKLPNIENPKNLMASPTHKIQPTGFGAIAAGWQPRMRYMGTCDKQWELERAPHLPYDFSMRFFNVAPEDMQFSPYLKGGEPIVWEKLTPGGRVAFVLPIIKLLAEVSVGYNNSSIGMNLDTVCFSPDEKEMYMVWRGVIPEKFARNTAVTLSLQQ
jgi:hypothetical protein